MLAAGKQDLYLAEGSSQLGLAVYSKIFVENRYETLTYNKASAFFGCAGSRQQIVAHGVINCSVLELISPYFRPDFTLVSACGLRANKREREREREFVGFLLESRGPGVRVLSYAYKREGDRKHAQGCFVWLIAEDI